MTFYSEMPEPEEPDSSGRPNGCFIFLTIIVIVALLGSALAAAAWLLLRQRNDLEDPIIAPIAETTSTPVESETGPTVAAEPSAAPTATTMPELSINRIAYVNNEGQIATIAADGRDARVVSDENQIFRFPAWSPNGKQIAAIGSNNLGSSVFVFMDDEIDNEANTLYFGAREAPFYLYWAPNSQTISFLANNSNGIGLHLVPADGTNESRLRTTGSPFYWQWAADSQQILLHSGVPGPTARLELIEVAGDEDGEQIADPGFFRAPGISEDGRLLAYTEALENLESQIIVSDTESGENQTEKYEGVTALSFNSTANYLAFISPDLNFESDSIGPLMLMDVANGDITTLNRTPVIAFFWSPDGRYLAAFVPENSQGEDINATGAKTVFTAKPAQQLNLPTLRLVVFDIETGEGVSLLSFTPTLTFLTQFVPFFDQYALSHRIWSPASDAIVLPVLEDGRSQLYIVPVQGGQKEWLALGSMAFWSYQ